MNILRRMKNIRYINEKFRFLLFVFALFLVLFLARYLLGMAYARYEVRTKISANIDKALYIFEGERIAFNLQPLGMVPTDNVYDYHFSVANFNASKQSDVDLTYQVKIRTTTNLPLAIKLYRNELHTASGATNILGSAIEQQDEDGAWYRLYETVDSYDMPYSTRTTDYFTLIVLYEADNYKYPVYANYLDNIQIILESQQDI